jgi:DNA-directed RNA polymerase subunit RPC12/RpoP
VASTGFEKLMNLPNCPNCGHNRDVREIFYGMPAFPIDEDRYEIGGCCVYPGMPLFKCRGCGWTSDEFPKANEALKCWYCGQKDGLKQINFLISGSTDYNRFIWDGGQLELDSTPIYRCDKCGWQGSLVFLGEQGPDPL